MLIVSGLGGIGIRTCHWGGGSDVNHTKVTDERFVHELVRQKFIYHVLVDCMASLAKWIAIYA